MIIGLFYCAVQKNSVPAAAGAVAASHTVFLLNIVFLFLSYWIRQSQSDKTVFALGRSTSLSSLSNNAKKYLKFVDKLATSGRRKLGGGIHAT